MGSSLDIPTLGEPSGDGGEDRNDAEDQGGQAEGESRTPLLDLPKPGESGAEAPGASGDGAPSGTDDAPTGGVPQSEEEVRQRLLDPSFQEEVVREARAFRENPDAFDEERKERLRRIRNAYDQLTDVSIGGDGAQTQQGGSGQGEGQERRPRAPVEEQGLAEGAANAFMRGVNDVQGFFSRVGESATGAVGAEGVSDYFERLAEEQEEDRAAYARSEAVAEKQQEIQQAQENAGGGVTGQIEGIAQEFQEDPVGSFRWLASKAIETSPTLATSVAGSAAGSAAAGSTAPVWGPIAGAFAAASAIETGAQLGDAAYNEQGIEREPSAKDEAAAWISGTLAGVPEILGAGKIAGDAIPIGRAVDNVLAKTPFDEATKKAFKRDVGQAMKGKVAEVAGQTVAEGAESVGRAGTSAVTEGLTEGLQSVIADVGASYGWDPEREIGQNWAEETLIGAALGGGVTAATEAGSAAVSERTSREERIRQNAQQAPIEENRRIMRESDDPTTTRILADVIENRTRSDQPEIPVRQTEQASEEAVRESRQNPTQILEQLAGLQGGGQSEDASDTGDATESEGAANQGEDSLAERGADANVAVANSDFALVGDQFSPFRYEDKRKVRVNRGGQEQVITYYRVSPEEADRADLDTQEIPGEEGLWVPRNNNTLPWRQAVLRLRQQEEEFDVTSEEVRQREERIRSVVDEVAPSQDQSTTDSGGENGINESAVGFASDASTGTEGDGTSPSESDARPDRLGDLVGQQVEVSGPDGPVQGRLQRTETGDFEVQMPEGEPNVLVGSARVESARVESDRPAASETPVTPVPEPTVNVDPEAGRLEVDGPEQSLQLENARINVDESGEPVNVRGELPSGETRTVRREEVVGAAAIEQNLAALGVPANVSSDAQGQAQNATESLPAEQADTSAPATDPLAGMENVTAEDVEAALNEVERQREAERTALRQQRRRLANELELAQEMLEEQGGTPGEDAGSSTAEPSTEAEGIFPEIDIPAPPEPGQTETVQAGTEDASPETTETGPQETPGEIETESPPAQPDSAEGSSAVDTDPDTDAEGPAEDVDLSGLSVPSPVPTTVAAGPMESVSMPEAPESLPEETQEAAEEPVTARRAREVEAAALSGLDEMADVPDSVKEPLARQTVREDLTDEETAALEEDAGETPLPEHIRQVARDVAEGAREMGSRLISAGKKYLRRAVMTVALAGAVAGGQQAIQQSPVSTQDLTQRSYSDLIEYAERGLVKYGVYTPEEAEVEVTSLPGTTPTEAASGQADPQESGAESEAESDATDEGTTEDAEADSAFVAENTYREVIETVEYGDLRLASYRNRWANSEGMTYVAGPANETVREEGHRTYEGAAAVAHHLIMGPDAPDLTQFTSDQQLREASDTQQQAFEEGDWVPIVTREGNEVTIQYEQWEGQDLADNEYTPVTLRQVDVDRIDFDSEVVGPPGFQDNVSSVALENGEPFNSLVFTDKDAYGKFSGGSVVLIFEAEGGTVVHEYTGSINGIRNEIDGLKEEFGLSDADITLGVYDAGSYTGKAAPQGGTISTEQWSGYNPSDHAGSSLILPAPGQSASDVETVQEEAPAEGGEPTADARNVGDSGNDGDGSPTGGLAAALSIIGLVRRKREAGEPLTDEDIRRLTEALDQIDQRLSDLDQRFDQRRAQVRSRGPAPSPDAEPRPLPSEEGGGATSEQESGESEAPSVPADEVRDALTEVEQDTFGGQDEQTGLQGALLSGISDVEDTLDKAYAAARLPGGLAPAGETETLEGQFGLLESRPLPEQDPDLSAVELEEAETWALETLGKIDDYLQRDLSDGAEAAARRLKPVLSAVLQDLSRVRRGLDTQPDDTTPTTEPTQNENAPTRDVSRAAPRRTAAPNAGAPAEEAGQGPAEAAGANRRSASPQPARGGERGVGFPSDAPTPGPASEVATPEDMRQGVARAEAAVREQGFSPQIVDTVRAALESEGTPVSTPSGVERALGLGRALQEVEGAPTVRPDEIKEAVDVMAQGGLRRAQVNASDQDVAQRYDEALGVLDRAREHTEGSDPLLEGVEALEETSEARERVESQIRQIDAELEQVGRQIEEREQAIAEQAAEQREQGSMFDAGQDASAQQQGMFGSPGTGEQGEITAEDAANARERDSQLTDLRARQQRLTQEKARLERNKNQLMREVEEVTTNAQLKAAAGASIQNETEAAGVTRSGGAEPYSVGLAENGIERTSGGQVTYRREAGQVLVLNPDGTPVTRQSSKHDDAVLQALTDPDGLLQRLGAKNRNVSVQSGVGDPSAEAIAARSQDPFEIARKWLSIDTAPTQIEQAIEGTQFTPESVVDALERATVPVDQDPQTGYGLWKNAGETDVSVDTEGGVEVRGGDQTRGVDEVANGLAETLPMSEAEIITQIGNIIARHPGQNTQLQTQGRRARGRLEDRFAEVMGFSLGSDEASATEFAEALLEARVRAEMARTVREANEMRKGTDPEAQVEADQLMQGLVRQMERKGLTPDQLLEGDGLSIGAHLSETERRIVRLAYEKYQQETGGADGAPFSRMPESVAGVPAGTALEIIRSVAQTEAKTEGLPEPTVVERPSDLPEGPREKFVYAARQYDGFVQPAFVADGTVYVVASHLAAAAEHMGDTSIADLTRQTLLHEWAHQGTEALWGENYEEVMAGLYEEIGRAEIEERLSSNYDARFRGDVTAADKAFLADEYLAHVAEDMMETTDPGLLRRIVNYLKRQWNRITGAGLTEAEMGSMLVAAYDAKRAEATGSTVTGTRLAEPRPMMIGPDAMTFSEEQAFENPYDRLLRNEIGDRAAEIRGPLRDLAEGHARAQQAQARLARRSDAEADVRSSIERDRLQALSRMDDGESALRGSVALPDVLAHEALYDAYPELRDLTVRFDPNLSRVAGILFARNELVIGTGALEGASQGTEAAPAASDLRQEMKGVILHEVQHKIQDIEGWQNGANYASAEEIIRSEAEASGIDPDNEVAVMNWAAEEYNTETYRGAVQEVYRRTTGEIEAREVARRREMNALERAVKPPFVREGGDAEAFVIPVEEAFTQSAIPAQTPALQTKRVAVAGQGPAQNSTTSPQAPVRFSRRGDNIFEEAEESVNEDLASGQLDLTDLTPVLSSRTPELVAAGRPPVPDAPPPAWLEDGEPDTTEGGRLVQKIRNDTNGEEVGPRSIVAFAVGKIYPNYQQFLSWVEQGPWLDFQEPAHMIYRLMEDRGTLPDQLVFDRDAQQIQRRGRGRTDEVLGGPELVAEWLRLYVKSPGAVSDLTITKEIEQALDEINTDFVKALRDSARAWEAHTGRSSRAQLNSVDSDVGKQPGLGFKDRIDELIYKWVNSSHAIERLERLVFRSLKSASNEDPSFSEQVMRATGFADSEATAEARRVLNEFRDANVIPRAWHNAGLRALGSVRQAIDGRRNRRSGMQFLKTDTDLTAQQLDLLEESSERAESVLQSEVEWTRRADPESRRSGTLREALMEATEGAKVWLTDQAFVDLFDPISDDNIWDFEKYAKRKVELARHRAGVKTALHPDPDAPSSGGDPAPTQRQEVADAIRLLMADEGLTQERQSEIEADLSDYVKGNGGLDGIARTLPQVYSEAWVRRNTSIEPDAPAFPGAKETSVAELREAVAADEEAHPQWEEAFADMQEFADKALIMAVAGGLHSAEEAARMMDAHEAYLPLMREIDTQGALGGAGGWPDSGIRGADGSRRPVKPLMKNFEQRLRSIYEGYYHNAAMVSMIRMTEHVAADESLPFQTREMMRNIVEEIHREPQIEANLGSEEIRSIVAENLPPDVNPDDIAVDATSRPVVRLRVDDGPDVIAPMVNGERVFYKVSDPILLDYFTKASAQPNETVQAMTEPFEQAVQPWKRTLTQNVVFAVRQMGIREPATAIGIGLPPEANMKARTDRWKQAVPWFATSVGMVEKWTGQEIPDDAPVGTMLSDSFQATNSQPDRTRVEKGLLEQFKAVVGQGIMDRDYNSMSWGELLSSAPAVLMNALLKFVEVPLWATGQRRLSIGLEEANRTGAFRMARNAGLSVAESSLAFDTMFGNFGDRPASGTMHSLYRAGGFVNPAMQITYSLFRRLFSMDPEVRRRTAITRIGGVTAFTALVWALNQLLTPDEDKDELRERSDEEKLRNIALGGKLRLPFDHGPVGTVQSFTYNLLEMQRGRGARDGTTMAYELITRFLESPVSSPASLINPQLKALVEAKANYSFYFNEEIVPPMFKFDPPPEQAPSDTPGEYKFLGEVLNTSPLKVEHVISSGVAYQVDDVLQFKTQVERGEAEPSALLNPFNEDNPFVGRVWQRAPVGWRSQSVQTIAEKGRRFESAQNEYEAMQENLSVDPSEEVRKRMRRLQTRMEKLMPYKRQYDRIQDLWRQVDQLMSDGEYERAKEIERRMTDVATRFLDEQEGGR